MKKRVLLLIAVACLMGCKAPLERTFSADNKSEIAEAIQNNTDISAEQKTELALYLLRVSGDNDWNADPNNFAAVSQKYAQHFPEGKTPQQVIDEQMAFEEEQAKQTGMSREEMQTTSGPGDGITPEMVAQAEQAESQPQTTGPIFPALSQLAGKSPSQIVQALGQPTTTETVKPSGTNCPCPKSEYTHNKLRYEVVYINQKADWITITAEQEGLALPVKPGALTLAALGLEPHTPYTETPAGLQWQNIAGHQLIQADEWMIYVKHKTP